MWILRRSYGNGTRSVALQGGKGGGVTGLGRRDYRGGERLFGKKLKS
jgi:hypothetical protein